MKIEEQLGMRIRYLRSQRFWSQEDLALECDVATSYISDLERGRRNPTLRMLEKISNAFGITISELTKGLESFKV